MMADALRPIRDRLENTRSDALGRVASGPSAYPAVVGRVFANPSTPTQGGRYVSVRPVEVVGAESEGAIGTLTVDAARPFLAYVPGAAAPAVGEDLICRFVGNRWVAEPFSSSSGNDQVTIPGCPCANTPRVLRMTSSLPLSNNQMFQNAVISHRDTPSALLPAGMGTKAYFSESYFVDHETGDLFLYYLFCYQNSYLLTRVYETSIYGSPFRDLVRYSWMVGQPGNTCQPFLLSGGAVFPGGDPNCVVTITE